MKILIIIPYFYPAFYYGGPVRSVYEITRRLAKKGHGITVFTTDVFDSRNRYHKLIDIVEGVDVRYFKNISNNLACRYHAFLPLGFYSSLRDSCMAYDLIHINEYYTLLAVAAARFARKYSIPFLFSAHGSLPVTPERGNQGRKMLFNKIFGEMIFKGISKVVALNEAEKRQFLDFGIESRKIEVIPNGIDTDEFKGLPDSMEFRKKYGIEKEEKIILYVGRIHEIKGLDKLLMAFKEISRDIKGVKLILVGPDDGYMGRSKEMASELGISSKVFFAGLLSGKEKLSAYAAADLFVLPSRSEGFPIAALEACASSIPVVITDRCNFPDVTRHNAGFEVPCNESALYDAIKRLLDNPALIKEMGRNGRDMVFNNYDWDRLIIQMEEVYKSVIN